LRNTIGAVAVALLGAGAALGQEILVPNGSFERPATFFVITLIDDWQETPRPDWFQEGGGFTWDQLTGVFRNTPPGAADHIDNCDGDQALYLFAVPAVGLFQDFDSVDWEDLPPSRAFDAKFEAGKSYQLTFGIVAGGGNMLEGVSLEAALYFRNEQGQAISVAATNVVYSKAEFPTKTHLSEIMLRTPVVAPNDAWQGRHVGVRFLSTVSAELQGGYWDLDHVRLTAVGAPTLRLSVAPVPEGLRLTWPTQPGTSYQLRRSADLKDWLPFGEPIPGTGAEAEQVVPAAQAAEFFTVVPVPAG
jgi:hypothetical protein